MSAPVEVALEHGVATVRFDGPETAPTVVVVPALGMPAGVLDPFVTRLAERLRVAVVELPGAGGASSAPPWVSTRALAASLASVVAALGVGPCHLFGISLGGMVAQWMAIDAPAQIDSLVLASTAARGLDVVLSGPLEKLAIAARVLGTSPARVALAEGVVSAEVRDDPVEMGRLAHEIEDAPRPASELVWLAGAVARHDTREHLGRIAARTLVLSGEHDELVVLRVQDELAAAIPDAERAIVPAAGHAITLDQPEASARVVEAFLVRTPLQRVGRCRASGLETRS